MADTLPDELTRDSIAEEALEILQRRDGYRFGLDAVLLATDLPDFPADGRVVELGAAMGIVSLCVGSRHPELEVIGLERQPSLVELFEANIEANDLTDRVRAKQGDVREIESSMDPHSADLVLCNPPYYEKGSRRPSDDRERAEARMELEGTLSDFVQAAQYISDQRGRLKIIVPPIRTRDLYRAVDTTDFSFEQVRYFHSREDEEAYLVEYVLRRGGAPDVSVRSPLFVYDGSGEYGPEVRARIDSAAEAR